MEFIDFLRLVGRFQTESPKCFGLPADRPATSEEVRVAESALGVALPDAYRRFVAEFGGGYFALGIAYSVQHGSVWNIVTQNQQPVPHDFVAVSENGAGDLYGFRVIDGKCTEEIYLWDHETNAVQSTSFADLYEYLVNSAFLK